MKAISLAAALCAASLTLGCGGSDDSVEPGVFDSQLTFDKTKYTTITATLEAVATPVSWYCEVCYVDKPPKAGGEVAFSKATIPKSIVSTSTQVDTCTLQIQKFKKAPGWASARALR
jgi:hypothetical protein